jgi:hypothetical protein
MKNSFQHIHEKDLFTELHKLKTELRLLRKEIELTHSDDLRVKKNIRFLLNEFFPEHRLEEARPGLIHRAHEIPSIESHYGRNLLMPVSSLPQSPEIAVASGWDDSVGAACHQFTSPDRSNIKYVSPDGHSEVIFDRSGHIVTAPEDYGTYNYVDSRQDPVGHFYQDVLPWLLWGNDAADSTDMHQRLKAFVIYGGIEAAHSHSQTTS